MSGIRKAAVIEVRGIYFHRHIAYNNHSNYKEENDGREEENGIEESGQKSSCDEEGCSGKERPNLAFMKAMKPTEALAKIVGNKPLPRTEVTKKLWEYIKKNKL